MKLTALKYGETEIHERMAFQDGDKTKNLPIALLFFLIETDGKKILVDVGCDTMPGFPLFRFQKPVEVLESCGVKPEEITHVILTHAHHDHADAARYYPQATVYLHRDAFPLAEKYLPQGAAICLIDEEKTVAKGVTFRHIGGHAPGSSIVLVETPGKPFVLCGDECYTKENLTLKKPTGSSRCLEASTAFVEEYSKDCYVPILFHDPDLVAEIGCKTLWDN